MRLGFDIDGIVCDMAQAMVDHMNEKYGLNYDITVFYNHELGENKYVEDPKLNEEITKSMKHNVIRNNDVLLELKPYDDSIRHLHVLRKNGHEIFFITSRSKDNEEATFKWLRKNKVPFDGVYVVGRKNVVGQGGKGPVGRMLNLDFFIDDDFPNLEDMYRYKGRWRKGLALFTRPWNEWMKLEPDKYVRITDWPEIVRHIGIANRSDIIHHV
jgi:uncharacterized HAD superfamily protein